MTKVILLAGCVAAAGITWAGPEPPQHHQDGMSMGMGMMAGPVNQEVATAFVLPELQPELGLSSQQVMQLRELKRQMLSKGKDFSNKIAAKQHDLDGMISAHTSKGELVKKLLEQIGDLRAQQLFAGYETASRMKIVLMEDQRAKLAGMKPHDFHQLIMAHMSTADMMQMMQFVGGEGMMVSRMMMGGAMGQALTGQSISGVPAKP
jgi:hypothetical protein